MMNFVRFLFASFIVTTLLLTGCKSGVQIDNPYENVDWISHNRYKANLHTHTTRSDGSMSPNQVVDRFQELNYSILALTDHNEVTYPWVSFSELSPSRGAFQKLNDGRIDSTAITYEDRNPEEMRMFAIQGNEVSAPHHMGSFFTDYNNHPGEEDLVISEIGEIGGLILLNHPGRYTARDSAKYNVEWYVDLFQRHEHLTGMEVYNQGDRYPLDRILWDSILVRTMPGRPMWGYSNDDFHGGLERLGRNWNLFLLPELTEDAIRTGMLEGRFLYVYAVNGHYGPDVPEVKSIDIHKRKGIISIEATGQDSIRWISAGEVVARGNSIQISKVPEVKSYVRAEIFGPGSVTGTQPFGIVK